MWGMMAITIIQGESDWTPMAGNPIQAHGGGVLYNQRSRTYHWYGEYKDGPTYISDQEHTIGK